MAYRISTVCIIIVLLLSFTLTYADKKSLLTWVIGCMAGGTAGYKAYMGYYCFVFC